MTAMMHRYAVFAMFVLVLSACSERGEITYRTWVGPEGSNTATVTMQPAEDARNGEIFVDRR